MNAVDLPSMEESSSPQPREHRLSPQRGTGTKRALACTGSAANAFLGKLAWLRRLGQPSTPRSKICSTWILEGRDGGETGWLPLTAEGFLKTRWDEEKEVFMATPRRPDWKDAKWSEAKKQQRGGIVLLLDHIGAKHLGHEQATVALWRHLQSLTIAVEGELCHERQSAHGKAGFVVR